MNEFVIPGFFAMSSAFSYICAGLASIPTGIFTRERYVLKISVTSSFYDVRMVLISN